MAARNPNVLWAQLSDKVFLTLDIQEAEKPVVNVTNNDNTGNVSYKGKAKSHALGADFHDYSLDLDLYGAVDPAKSKISATARHVVLVIAKEAGSEGFWPRLTKDKAKQPYIKVDWDKWVDEDDEGDEAADPTSQFDFSDLSGFGGSGGVGADDDEPLTGGGATPLDGGDSDDEELPDLEKA
jgi:prostaglandin-E synthase